MKSDWLIHTFWSCIEKRDSEGLLKHFSDDAKIFWTSVDTVLEPEEYVRRVFEIPAGDWVFIIEKMDYNGDVAFTITKVTSASRKISFRAVSFFELKDNQIVKLDEYWSTNLEVPIPELKNEQ
ncbi:nuclear transport factor 2 family protein [Acholeplasma sp. OttesenSCG-928-E16]|nr:nuclear transport factor 2 family protein [Acholeplasma sp. OttesenSCG-928-E16]